MPKPPSISLRSPVCATSSGQHDLDEILQERNKINTLLGESISRLTGAWGLEVQRFEMKDVELPKAMQQVMAMQAEAIREKRARIIKAEAELEASEKLSQAAAQDHGQPGGARVAPHADDLGSWRREQQHHRADDPFRFRFACPYAERLFGGKNERAGVAALTA